MFNLKGSKRILEAVGKADSHYRDGTQAAHDAMFVQEVVCSEDDTHQGKDGRDIESKHKIVVVLL